MTRSEAYFDPGAKYHVAINAPYIRQVSLNVLSMSAHCGILLISSCSLQLFRVLHTSVPSSRIPLLQDEPDRRRKSFPRLRYSRTRARRTYSKVSDRFCVQDTFDGKFNCYLPRVAHSPQQGAPRLTAASSYISKFTSPNFNAGSFNSVAQKILELDIRVQPTGLLKHC